MKKTFLSTLFLIGLCSVISFSQKEEKEIERSLKIYTTFQYASAGNVPQHYFALPDFSFNSTAFSFYRENKLKGKFTEFSLSFSKKSLKGVFTQFATDTNSVAIPIIQVLYLGKLKELNIGLHFEKGRWIEKMSTRKLKVGFSTSVRVFVHLSDLTSFDSQFYPRERTQIYLALGLVPRVRYNLNSKVHLSLHLPFELFGVGVDWEKIKNPALTKRQQEQGGFNFSLSGETFIRLGIGYKF